MHGQIRTDSNSVLKVCANRFSSNKRMNWFIFSFTVTQNDLFIFILFVIYLKLTNLQNHCINNTIKNSQNKIG